MATPRVKCINLLLAAVGTVEARMSPQLLYAMQSRKKRPYMGKSQPCPLISHINKGVNRHKSYVQLDTSLAHTSKILSSYITKLI